MKNKLFSLLLALAMMITFMPVAAFANGGGSQWSVTTPERTKYLGSNQESVELEAYAYPAYGSTLPALEVGWSKLTGEDTWSSPTFEDVPFDDGSACTYSATDGGNYKAIFREKNNPSITKEVEFTVTKLAWGIKQDPKAGRYELTDPPTVLKVELEGVYSNPTFQWTTPNGPSSITTNTCDGAMCGAYSCKVTVDGASLTAYYWVEYPNFPEPVEKNDILYMTISDEIGRPTNEAAARQVYGEYDPDNPVDSPEGNLSGVVEIQSNIAFNDGVTRKVTFLGDFINSKITGVIIPSTVTDIEDEAFLDTAMTQVTIPSSVTEIGYHAFGYKSEGDDEVRIPGFVILGKSGSAAESYAKANGFTFKDIDAEAEEQARREAEQARQAAIAAAEAARQGTPGNLPKAKASKPKASKKAITVKWKKLNKKQLKKGVSKMEVWVSPNGSFANGSTIEKMVGKKKGSVKVKGLAKGTYFVKVRAITYSGGTKVVGPWSAVKTVKVKK